MLTEKNANRRKYTAIANPSEIGVDVENVQRIQYKEAFAACLQ